MCLTIQKIKYVIHFRPATSHTAHPAGIAALVYLGEDPQERILRVRWVQQCPYRSTLYQEKSRGEDA